MLHSCDAGEYSVLSIYGPLYSESYRDNFDERKVLPPKISAMVMGGFFWGTLDSHPIYNPFELYQNSHKLTRPFESQVAYSAHFVFSHGHFIPNAGYDSNLN